MRCLARTASACLLLSGVALAQAPLDDLYPVTAPVRNAGTVNAATGEWTRGGAGPDGSATVIYDNTCVFSGGAFFSAHQSCEAVYDEGRVPSSGDPMAPAAAADAYLVESFEIGYCTDTVGALQAKVAFWNNLGGECVGGVPPTPPPASTTATAFFDLAPLGLPGSTANGFISCWIVTIDTSASGFVLAGDGDGVYDGMPAQDLFTWSFQHDNAASPIGTGLLLAGDPAVGGFGACTFGNPCPGGCGTGLGTTDSIWINIDGGPAGCPAGVPSSGCYFFGGYPQNPYASFHLQIEGVPGGCPAPASYCTAKTSSSGCTPSIGSTGTPSPSGAFHVTCDDVEVNQMGIAVYSLSGPAATPFFGGTLCLQTPNVFRMPAQGSGGLAPCSGTYVHDMTSVIVAQPVGTQVWTQFWYRDAGDAQGIGLSDALAFTTCL